MAETQTSLATTTVPSFPPAHRVNFTHGEALDLYSQLQQHADAAGGVGIGTRNNNDSQQQPRSRRNSAAGAEFNPLLPTHIPVAIPTRFKYALEFDDALTEDDDKPETFSAWAFRTWNHVVHGRNEKQVASLDVPMQPCITEPNVRGNNNNNAGGAGGGVPRNGQVVVPSVLNNNNGDDNIPPDACTATHLAVGEQAPPKQRILPRRITCMTVVRYIINWFVSKLVCLRWLPHYDWRKCLKHDVIAGLTIGAMLVPQGIGYALVAGLPAVYGLYTAFMPQFVYFLMGTSRHLAVGPVSILSLLTATALSGIKGTLPDGSANPEYIKAASATAMVCGLIQMSISVLRLGFVVNLLSHPVIAAFTSGSAIIIGTGQLNNVIGYNFTQVTSMYVTLYNFFASLGHSNPTAIVMSVICFVILFGIKRFPRLKLVPTALLLVIIGTLVTWQQRLDKHGNVSITKTVPAGLPHGVAPTLVQELYPPSALFTNALVMALIGYMESNAVAKIYALKNKYVLDSNQELFALGLANIVGSCFGAYPSTGSFSRTAVNGVAGAKTLISSLVSGLTIMIVLLVLTPWFYYLPKPVLGCIIVSACANLFDLTEPKFLWRVNKLDFCVYIITFAVVLQWGVDIGLGIAVAVSLAVVILRSIIPTFAVLGRIPGTNIFRNIARFPESETKPGTLIMRFDKNLHFANVGRFVDLLQGMFDRNGHRVCVVVLDFSAVTDIDATSIHVLSECFKEVTESGRKIYVANAKGPCRDTLRTSGLSEIMGQHCIFLNMEDAVLAADGMAEAMLQRDLEEHQAGDAEMTDGTSTTTTATAAAGEGIGAAVVGDVGA